MLFIILRGAVNGTRTRDLQIEELYLHMKDLEDEFLFDRVELACYTDFLSWMDLWDAFICFRRNARPEQNPDEPFPRYVL